MHATDGKKLHKVLYMIITTISIFKGWLHMRNVEKGT